LKIKKGTDFQKAQDKSEVEVHYVGTLENGTKFDSSRDRDDTFKFTLGQGSVIKGWDVGVKTMKKGEISKFKIRGDYAYGERGSPPKIPANATLIFEIELINWNAIDSEKDITDNKDGGIMKQTIKEGDGWEQPTDGSTVHIHYTVKDSHTDENRESANLSFIVGDEITFDGFDQAVKKLKKKEVALFKIRSDYIFNQTGNHDISKGPIVPEETNLHVEIELTDFQKEKESYQLENHEKIQTAQLKKEEGNNFFKQGKYSLANKRYKKALSYIQYGEIKDDKNEVDQLKVSCHLNIAAILLKNKEYSNVISELKHVLEIEPNNVKALYRRSIALSSTGEFFDALRDLNKALEIEPQNKEVKREILHVKQLQKAQDDNDKNLYAKMLQGL